MTNGGSTVTDKSMSDLRLFLYVLIVVLSATYAIVKSLYAIGERTITFETYDDAEARKFQKDCDGFVRVHTRALKHTLICYEKREEDSD